MTTKVATNTIHVVLKLPTRMADYIVAGQKIHDTMAANPSTIKAPNPALTVLQTDLTTLVTKQAEAKTRAQGAVAARNAAKKQVADDLSQERAYVETLCNADPTNAAAIAGDAAMFIRKSAAPKVKAPLAVKAGKVSGAVNLVAKATKGARLNEWQYSIDGGKTWTALPATTKASTSMASLTPGATVTVQQRAFTKAEGWSNWTQPVSLLVT